MPREIDMKEPYWYVVSDANIDEFVARIKKETGGVFFGEEGKVPTMISGIYNSF